MQRRYKIQMKGGKGPGIFCLFLQGQESREEKSPWKKI